MRENREITGPGSVPVPLSALYRQLDEYAADGEAPYDLPAGLQRLTAWMAETVQDDSEAMSARRDTRSVLEDVHAAVGGDEGAWRRLVERFMPVVRSVIRSYSLSGQDAEDVSQTLWLRLVERLKDVRDPNALPGWIVTMTRNECVRLLQSSRRIVPVAAAVKHYSAPGHVPEMDERSLAPERHQALLQAIAQLPEHQRNLLILLVADPPLSYAEISRRLGVPIGSIGPNRFRALQKLRECHAMAAIREKGTEGLR